MAIGKDLPQFNSETKPFARWKLEVQTWVEVTKHAKEKRGMVLALSLPEKDNSDVRTKVFEGLGLDKLKGETGFKNLIDFLDKEDVNVTNDYRNRSGTFPKGNGGGFRGGSGRGGFQNRNAGGYGGKVGFGGNRGGNQGQWNGGSSGHQRNNGGGGNGGRGGGNGGRNNFGNQQNGGNSGNKKQKPLNPVDQNGDPQL